MFPTKGAEAQERYFVFLFWVDGGLMLKSTGLQQFWFEHETPTGYNKVPRCSWLGEAGGSKVGTKLEAQPILLVLGPLDALEINAILHHLPERAHFSKTLHMVNALLHCVVHFLLCSETANAKPDRRVS